jgi:signal transduction histidine kinase
MLVGHKASAMGKQLRKRLAPGLPAVLVNPGEIEQAALNITLNGLEAMRNGGRTLYVSTGAHRSGRRPKVYIRVRDEGCGLPQEKLEEIFTPFFSMREQGTGLGLFISQRIVKDHGGTLRARSRPGQGATFEIWLPAAEAVSAA